MQKISKTSRLRKTPEFKRVYDARNVAADAVLIVFALPNDREECRLGLSVSKKVGNAVVRNRWKRCIREAFRHSRDELPQCYDIVVIPQRGAVCPGMIVVRRSFVKLVQKIDRRRTRMEHAEQSE